MQATQVLCGGKVWKVLRNTQTRKQNKRVQGTNVASNIHWLRCHNENPHNDLPKVPEWLRGPMPNPLMNAAEIMKDYQPKTNDPKVKPGKSLFTKPIRPLSKRELEYFKDRAEKLKQANEK